MNRVILRRTILAVAVSAATISGSAMARPISSYDMSIQQDALEFSGNVSGFDLTGTGTVNHDFVGISEAIVTGDVINNATLTGSDFSIDGFDIDGFEFGDASVFNGNLENRGALNLNGTAATGILLDNVHMNGSVLNKGSINVTGGFDSVDAEGAAGIRFWNVTAVGDTRNDGTISVTGDQAIGFEISSSTLEGYLINGSNAVVDVKGVNSDGISAFSSDIAVIVNHGSITAEGAGATGIDLDHVTSRMLVNSGTIEGKGADSVGILLDNVDLDYDSEYTTAQHGIVNAGTIKGEKYGLVVEGPLSGDNIPLYVNMNGGTLSGGEAAIKGNNQDITLNWKSGLIEGDLLNVGDVNVAGYTVFDGEMISGNGSRTLTVKQNGYLNLQGTHSQITDDLLVQDGGALSLLVKPETVSTDAILSVGGTATFEQGSHVYLEASPYDFAPNNAGQRYLIVDAENIVNNGLDLSSQSYLLEVKDFSVLGGQLVATLAMRDFEVIEEIIEQSGADANGQAAFMPLVSLLSGMDVSDPVFQAIINATPEERAVIAQQLQPEVNSGSTQAAVGGQAAIVSAVTGRTDGLRTSESTGDMLAETGAWFQVLNNDANQDRRDGIDGYSADTNGFTLGADGKLNTEWTVGLAYTFLQTDVKSQDGNKTDVDGHSLTGYSSFSLDHWFADSSITYSKNDNSSQRFIVGTEAKADYDSDMLGLSVEGGYTFALSPSFALEPLAALRYAAVNIDSYNEKGSTAALSVGSQRYEVAEAGLGLRAKGNFPLGKGAFKPEAKVMAYHDYAGDQSATTSTFVLGGSAFTTTGASPARDTYQAGIGGTYELGSLTFGLMYDYTAKSGFDADTFTGKVRFDF